MTGLRSISNDCFRLLDSGAKRCEVLDNLKGSLARARQDQNHAWIQLIDDEQLDTECARVTRLADDGMPVPLFGVPFGVKDNIDVAGLPTTAACPSYAYRPAKDSPTVNQLRAAGAIVLGKTNMDQFATGLVGTRSPHGAPRSVVSPAHISGGSSSGSAVVVADGTVGFSLGTDTAGSGRVPAAFNEIVGLKPTRGLLSTSGVVPACRSLDCVSIFAPSVEIAERVFSLCVGYDEADPYSRRTVQLAPLGDELVLGTPGEDQLEFFSDRDAAGIFASAISLLRGLAKEVRPIDYRPFRAAAELLYGGPWVAERYAAVGEFLEKASTDLDPIVRAIIAGGKSPSAVDVFRGMYELTSLRRNCDAEWEKMDVLVLPTTPTTYTLEQVAKDPVGTNVRLGTYTNFVNLLDLCAIAVPAGVRSDGASLGITLLAPAFHEQTLTRLAGRYCAALTGD